MNTFIASFYTFYLRFTAGVVELLIAGKQHASKHICGLAVALILCCAQMYYINLLGC